MTLAIHALESEVVGYELDLRTCGFPATAFEIQTRDTRAVALAGEFHRRRISNSNQLGGCRSRRGAKQSIEVRRHLFDTGGCGIERLCPPEIATANLRFLRDYCEYSDGDSAQHAKDKHRSDKRGASF